MVKISGVGSEKLKVSPVQDVTGAYYAMETEAERYKREEATQQIDKEHLYHIETAKQMGISTSELTQIEKELKEKAKENIKIGRNFPKILKDATTKINKK